MQVRFLELLEGLPEEVQTALLEVAYERACLNINSTLEVAYYGQQVSITTQRFNFVEMTSSRANFSRHHHTSKLSAWREAFERLKE